MRLRPRFTDNTMPCPLPIRKPCPAGACICEHAQLLEQADADLRVLRLTQQEERLLLAKLESLTTLAELEHVCQRMQEQLGLVLTIAPAAGEVRSTRGLRIELQAQPGLCRKTRQAVPAAVRRGMERHPGIVYALLNARDLLA